MSNLKQLRGRVRSISSTQKITKAMQLVSASKLKRIKEQADELNAYSEILADIMFNIGQHDKFHDLSVEELHFFMPDPALKTTRLLIVLTSERGLCGSFNSSILKHVKSDIEKFQQAGEVVKLLIVGKKGYDALKGNYGDLVAYYHHLSKDNLEALSIEIRDEVINLVKNGDVTKCHIYYNEFKNAMTQIPTKMQILPVDTEYVKGDRTMDYSYEGEGLVMEIISCYVYGQVNYGLIQNRASEEGARMTAMDNATRNAGELIQDLTLTLNRNRQAIITTELIEIIAGAESF